MKEKCRNLRKTKNVVKKIKHKEMKNDKKRKWYPKIEFF